MTFIQELLTLEETKTLITSGKKLLLAGDEEVIKQLPTGNWIGGTIPYFMSESGGISTRTNIYVTHVPDFITDSEIKVYTEANIANVFKECPENGFSLIIIPSSSPIHFSFALNGPNYKEFAVRPLIGWIAGIHLDDLGKLKAKVFDGHGDSIKSLENEAVVMHVSLPKGKYGEIEIINIFTQGEGDTIQFLEDGFSTEIAVINGEEKNLAKYIKENNLDIRFPLVSDYYGAMINVSFQSIDEEKNIVNFYAPVFKGAEYKQAKVIADYVAEFANQVPEDKTNIAFSCNCILNYLYGELEGKNLKGQVAKGPMTFGEIAYQLLNQTLAYIEIKDLESKSEI